MEKVIIIGAGPAGLTAAIELLKNGGDYDVTILEGSQAMGGISQTVRYNGNRMDIGGHRFFSKNQQVMDWWADLMPLQGKPAYDDKKLGHEKPLAENGPDPETEDNVMLVRDRVSRIYYNKHFFDYPISMKPETIKNMGFVTTMKAGFSYLWACVFKKVFGTKNKGEVETSLIEQFWYPKYGPGQLWETAAEKVKELGGKILTGCQVKKIMCEGRKVTSVVCDTAEGEKTFTGDIFISSMPVKDLILGMDGTKPCDTVIKIAKGLPYRDFVTVGLLVNKLNLKNETNKTTLGNIVPDCWIYVQDKGVKLGRIQIFNNWSPYMVEKPEDTVWIGLEYFCAEGDDFWNMSEEDCVKFATAELVKMGVISENEVLDSHREKVKKAYPAYFDTYKHFDTMIKFLDTFPNLYCVGRNGQHRYNNMDHSMLTAMETAEAIKTGKKSRKDIWNVNTEKEYHEEKSGN